MKSILIILLLMFNVFSFAQDQKKKQFKRMMEQIAANKVYIEYLEKGYNIARDGLHTIRDIKHGDLKMHLDYFNSLKRVNPKIKNWAKVAQIISYQVRIINDTRKTLIDIREAHQFTNVELDYCKGVFDNLLNECVKNIDELMLVITNGKTEMKDDERAQRINKLYEDMQDKYSFTSSFSSEMGMLSMQRLTEQVDINYSKRINRIQ
jgi:hypothetical protein